MRNERFKWAVMAFSRYWYYVRTNSWLQKFIMISMWGIESQDDLQCSWFLSSYMAKKIAPPYTSPDLAQNLISGQLRMPLIYQTINLRCVNIQSKWVLFAWDSSVHSNNRHLLLTHHMYKKCRFSIKSLFLSNPHDSSHSCDAKSRSALTRSGEQR